MAFAVGFLPPDWRSRTYLALAARMSLVGSYCLMFLYAAELFPTAIRSSGFGVGFFFFMTGGMLSPLLKLLVKNEFFINKLAIFEQKLSFFKSKTKLFFF